MFVKVHLDQAACTRCERCRTHSCCHPLEDNTGTRASFCTACVSRLLAACLPAAKVERRPVATAVH